MVMFLKMIFFFEGKRLNARWYAPPEPEYPRIFISELIVDDMPEEIQKNNLFLC